MTDDATRSYEVTVRPKNPRLPFVRAIKTDPGVRLLFLAGALGVPSEDADPATSRPEDIRDEARNVFRRLQAVLEESGASFQDLVQITKYMTNVEESSAVMDVAKEFLGDHLPTSTTVQVERLVPPGYRLEIDGIAVLPADR